MHDLVALDLHAPGPEQRNADSGERRGIFKGRARARVVLYLVTTHVKHTRRTRGIGQEKHPHAIVVDLVTDDLAMAGITHEDAQKVTGGFVGSHSRVRVGRVTHVESGVIGSACKVSDHLRSGRGESGDPVSLVVDGTIGHELGVSNSGREDPEFWEVTHREAAYGHVVCLDAKARCPAGGGRLCRRLEHRVDPAQRDSVLLDRYGLMVDAPRTTMVSPGSAALIAFWIDSPGRTTCPLGFAEAKPQDTSSDKATSTAIVVIKTMRLICATSL